MNCPSQILERISVSIESMFSKSNLISKGVNLGIVIIDENNICRYAGANQEFYILNHTDSDTHVKTLKSQVGSLGNGNRKTNLKQIEYIQNNSIIYGIANPMSESNGTILNPDFTHQIILQNFDNILR